MDPKAHIQSAAEKLLSLLDFPHTSIVVDERTDQGRTHFLCDISAKEDSRFLIGHSGGNLHAFQQILTALVRKENEAPVSVVVDVNAYRAQKNEALVHVAQEAGARANAEKKPIVLAPMSAYERRIIHTTLADHERVETESIGESSERKVVVKPRALI